MFFSVPPPELQEFLGCGNSRPLGAWLEMGLQRVKPYHLTLFFSNRYSYAQITHKAEGRIVAAASTIEKALRTEMPSTSDKQASSALHPALVRSFWMKSLTGCCASWWIARQQRCGCMAVCKFGAAPARGGTGNWGCMHGADCQCVCAYMLAPLWVGPLLQGTSCMQDGG